MSEGELAGVISDTPLVKRVRRAEADVAACLYLSKWNLLHNVSRAIYTDLQPATRSGQEIFERYVGGQLVDLDYDNYMASRSRGTTFPNSHLESLHVSYAIGSQLLSDIPFGLIVRIIQQASISVFLFAL